MSRARKESEDKTYIHVLLSCKEHLAGRVQQQHALGQVQRAEDQQVVLAVAAARQQPVERVEQPLRNVPLKALLQLEELEERRVVVELFKRLVGGLVLVFIFQASPALLGLGRRQTDGSKQSFDLLEALFYLGAVVGRQVVECEGEEGLHCVGEERRMRTRKRETERGFIEVEVGAI